jgi:hypothetical protein
MITINSPDTDETPISKIHTFKGYWMFMRSDHIIQLEFEDGFYGEVEDAQNMIATFRILNEGTKHKLMVLYKENNMFSKEAREYISGKEISDEVLAADAMVIKGLALKLLANVYLKINRPGRPTCLFNTKEDALAWLKKITVA